MAFASRPTAAPLLDEINRPGPLVADWDQPYDPDRRREWIQLFLLLAVTAVAFAPSLSGGFLWRDDQVITANESIRSFRAVGHTWLHPRSVPVWRPVADTVLACEHALWGSWNPTGYRIISLALHLLATMLLWLVLRRLAVPAALAGAGLFALHPVAVHTVAWPAQQPVLLASVFLLLSLLCWLRGRDFPPPYGDEFAGDSAPARRRSVFVFATFAFFVAALLCNAATSFGMAMALPFIVWWKGSALADPGEVRRFWALLAVTLLLTVFVPWARPAPLGSDIDALLPHAWRLVFPYPLLLSYSPLSPMWQIGLAVAALGIIVAIWVLGRRLPRGATAPAWTYYLMLLPVLWLGEGQSDPQQYLARAALLVLLAGSITRFIPEGDDDGPRRFLRPIVATVLVALLGAQTWMQAGLCRSNRAAWEHVLAHDPSSRQARLELGNEALARRDPGGAVEQFERLVAQNANDAEAQLRLGVVLLEQGRTDEAMARFEQSAKLRPGDPSVWRHLAAAATRKDDLPAAVGHYEKALAIDPRDDVAQNNLATLYVRLGQIDRAIAAYKRALDDNPRNASAHVNLARLLFDAGRAEESSAHLQQAVKIDPNNFDAYMTAGNVLMQMKEFHQATRMFQQAVHLRRDSPAALNALGVALAAQGRYDEAIFRFGRALDVDPNYGPAKQNLEAARRDREGGATTRTSR